MSSVGVSESIFLKVVFVFLLWNSLGPFATVFLAGQHTFVKIVDQHNASVPQFLLVLIVKFDSCYFNLEKSMKYNFSLNPWLQLNGTSVSSGGQEGGKSECELSFC